jgi:hypothetical protein
MYLMREKNTQLTFKCKYIINSQLKERVLGQYKI